MAKIKDQEHPIEVKAHVRKLRAKSKRYSFNPPRDQAREVHYMKLRGR